MPDPFSVVDPSEIEAESFNTCETAVRKLTDSLGATELRGNQVLVDPGEVTTPHTHAADGDTPGQEEVFVAMTDGQIAIEGEVHDVDAGNVVRVAPETERNLLNRTDDATHVWLAFGAPPIGTVEDFGGYVVSDAE
jgi:quercetin dioxygenase-like cupin family protein